MIRNRIYYGIKPLLPSSVRLGIRRWFALRKRAQVDDVWPIKPGSEVRPQGWPGWPQGKQFALVLTHDVESPVGLEKVQRLMQLELSLGFRSSFNLIPEGSYHVSPDVRNSIQKAGFEVGVHDLHHDGKLFLTQREFRRNAIRINQYLAEWKAGGFRSGFMLHNLDWIHDLNVRYDASTFDTDPFEPQPQGRHTIFPFWVPRSAHPPDGHRGEKDSPRMGSGLAQTNGHSTINDGYVELPYTLPQDSTLFLLLGERHPDIWFQKLDWVARNGGMALVNVHPDYARFEDEAPSSRTYPIEFYTRFLRYARQRYGDSFWQPLPREVAAFIGQEKPHARRRPRRICMVTHSFYTSDARVTRYAEALAERGDHVDVVALRRSPDLPSKETIGKVHLLRIQPRFAKNQTARLAYLLPVLRFLLTSSAWITRQHVREPYDLLHIHNVPDFLIFAAWYPRLKGAKLILDIHDIVPEFYASKFGSRPNSFSFALLTWIERLSARFADRVIIANHLWRDKYAHRTGADGKCSVFINNVDSDIFRPMPRRRPDGKLVVMFPGGLQRHQGLDIAIRAFQKVIVKVPSAEFHIYGDGNMKSELVALAKELGLERTVQFFKPLPVRSIAKIMAEADLGVVPKRADSFGNEAYSTKIMEFMSLGVPVVVSETKIDRYYFDDSVVRFFESGNPDALARAMLEVMCDQRLREGLATRGLEYARRNNWESRKADYLDLVDSLTWRDQRTEQKSNHGGPILASPKVNSPEILDTAGSQCVSTGSSRSS